MLENPNIPWNIIELKLQEISDPAERMEIWRVVDRACWGREDCERLDELMESTQISKPATV